MAQVEVPTHCVALAFQSPLPVGSRTGKGENGDDHTDFISQVFKESTSLFPDPIGRTDSQNPFQIQRRLRNVDIFHD